jgi:hypothetical protein
MTMIATDELTDGKLIDLPPEAGDVTQPRFEPVEAWLRSAEPAAQKTAMWRWFATRYEELGPSTPHDTAGNSSSARKARRCLRTRCCASASAVWCRRRSWSS